MKMNYSHFNAPSNYRIVCVLVEHHLEFQLLLSVHPSAFAFSPGIPVVQSDATSAPSVRLDSFGQLRGRSQVVKVGTAWKQVYQFLGVPYAAPPLADNRFWAPEVLNWTGTWDATKPRYGTSGTILLNTQRMPILV